MASSDKRDAERFRFLNDTDFRIYGSKPLTLYWAPKDVNRPLGASDGGVVGSTLRIAVDKAMKASKKGKP